jgi:hypothetical protein
VVDTWAAPKVVLMRMDKYGSTTLCEKQIPEPLASQYLQSIGGLKGIHELSPEIRSWLEQELDA